MKFSTATITIEGIAPLRFSKRHDAPKLTGESADAYDARTVMEKAHWSEDGSTLVIPATMMKAAIAGAASYTGEKIAGKGNRTWTGKFKAGTAIMQDIETDVPRSEVRTVSLYCDAQGGKGGKGGKSVLRRFPQANRWSATFEIWVMDPEITETKVRQMLDVAGMFGGLGTWAPRVGGMNGRFVVKKLLWKDNREFEPVTARSTAPKVTAPVDKAA